MILSQCYCQPYSRERVLLLHQTLHSDDYCICIPCNENNHFRSSFTLSLSELAVFNLSYVILI